MDHVSTKPIVLAITGASGAVYGIRTLEALLGAGETVELIISRDARRIVEDETGLGLGHDAAATAATLSERFPEGRLYVFDDSDLYAPSASGSHQARAMAVVPCSMKTLASIANGLAGSLITRSADVCLKEGRRLVLVPRETPLSAVHLENMLKLARLGVRIVPPVPAFYNRPRRIEDLVDFVVARILDQLGVQHDLSRRWGAP